MREGRRFPTAGVASAHHLASAAGLRVLASGGNALDAAVAANLTLGVVAPYLCGYGGDVFAVVWHEGEAHGYLGSGRAPAAATPDAVSAAVGERMPGRGPHTVTVPGAVQGWFDLLDRFGTRSFGELAAPAIGYARDGFELSGHGGLIFEFFREVHGDSWRSVYGEAGAGRLLRQPDLARTIETIADGGPDAYYRGTLADAMVACVREAGGLLDVDDLAGHTGEWCTPISAPYRDVEVLQLPPPTQGVTALEMLRIVDRSGPLPLDLVDRHHLLIEAAKLATADRDTYVTDPDHMEVDPASLLGDEWVDGRLERLDPSRAGRPHPGNQLPGGTAYFCAADGDGMLVSLIQTNFDDFGSGLTVPGWGVNLHNRGAMFSLDAGHVNVVAPRKRTLHTLIPALALRDGKPWLVFGTMSGNTQPQVHLQLLTRIVDEGADIQQAIDAARWRVIPGTWEVMAEPGLGDELVDALRRRGHDVVVTGALDIKMGHAHAIGLGAHGYTGASDPRSEGAALGF